MLIPNPTLFQPEIQLQLLPAPTPTLISLQLFPLNLSQTPTTSPVLPNPPQPQLQPQIFSPPDFPSNCFSSCPNSAQAHIQPWLQSQPLPQPQLQHQPQLLQTPTLPKPNSCPNSNSTFNPKSKSFRGQGCNNSLYSSDWRNTNYGL